MVSRVQSMSTLQRLCPRYELLIIVSIFVLCVLSHIWLVSNSLSKSYIKQGSSGAVGITTGGAASGVSGDLELATGAVSTAGKAGDIKLSVGDSQYHVGGSVSISGGASSEEKLGSTGGAVNVFGGDATTVGGEIALKGGDSTSDSATTAMGGAISITGGSSKVGCNEYMIIVTIVYSTKRFLF